MVVDITTSEVPSTSSGCPSTSSLKKSNRLKLWKKNHVRFSDDIQEESEDTIGQTSDRFNMIRAALDDPRKIYKACQVICTRYVSNDIWELIIGVLMVTGLWTIIKFIFSLLFSLIYPILMITAIAFTIPSWRQYIIQEYLPANIHEYNSYLFEACSRKFNNRTLTM